MTTMLNKNDGQPATTDIDTVRRFIIVSGLPESKETDFCKRSKAQDLGFNDIKTNGIVRAGKFDEKATKTECFWWSCHVILKLSF